MIELFDYQDRFVSGIRSAMTRSNRVLGVSPTGSGKTCMFSYMVSRARQRGRRIGVFAHRAELLEQISKALREFQVPHGIIASGCKPDNRHSVHVISAQTYARNVDKMPVFDLGIVDEAHHATKDSTWGKCMGRSPGARWVGVTATPERLDGRGLAESFDEMVMGPTIRELMDAGRLSDYRLFAPGGIDTSGLHTLGGDFNKKEAADAADRPAVTGDAIDHYRRLLQGAPSAAFCVSIEHAHHVAEQFRQAGYTAAHLDGKMDPTYRKQVIRDVRAGNLNLIASCDLLSEGFDVPGLFGALLLRPTQSLSLYLQQVGRVFRVFKGKTISTICDHAGNSADDRHGLPCLDRDWSLEGRKKGSVRAEASMSWECSRCYARWPLSRPLCPECGCARPVRAREIEARAGELQEVDKEAARAIAEEAARKLRVQQGQAKTVAALVDLGHSEGRASHIVQAREEKERLRADVVDISTWLQTATGSGRLRRADIWDMKPKQLRQTAAALMDQIHEYAIACAAERDRGRTQPPPLSLVR